MPKTILIVDDSAVMRKILIKNIKESGYTFAIEEAEDGSKALDRFQKGGIDIIMSDWNMPIMDGLTLVKEVRKIDPDKKVPIIMVTTEGSSDKVKEAVLAGASNYLAKPFTPEKLREKLSAYMD